MIWSQIERHRFAVICATPGTTVILRKIVFLQTPLNFLYPLQFYQRCYDYTIRAVASMRRTEALASVKFYQILSIFIFFIRLIILEDFIRLISYNGPCVRLGCSFFLATALTITWYWGSLPVSIFYWSHRINLPTHPSPLPSNPYLFWRLLRSLDRFTLSVPISISKPFRGFLPSEWDFIDDPVWSTSIF